MPAWPAGDHGVYIYLSVQAYQTFCWSPPRLLRLLIFFLKSNVWQQHSTWNREKRLATARHKRFNRLLLLTLYTRLSLLLLPARASLPLPGAALCLPQVELPAPPDKAVGIPLGRRPWIASKSGRRLKARNRTSNFRAGSRLKALPVSPPNVLASKIAPTLCLWFRRAT